MKFSSRHFIGGFSLSFIAIMLTVSCNKKNDIAGQLPLRNESALVIPAGTDTIFGRWGNPALGPTVFGTVYYNVITGAQDTVGTVNYNLTFTSTNNSTIGKRNSTDTLRYLNTTKALMAINAADFTAATAVTTLGQNTSSPDSSVNAGLNANGWWNYNSTTHVVEWTRNVVLFFKAAGSNTAYAFKFNGAWGQGGPTFNRGLYRATRGAILF